MQRKLRQATVRSDGTRVYLDREGHGAGPGTLVQGVCLPQRSLGRMALALQNGNRRLQVFRLDEQIIGVER